MASERAKVSPRPPFYLTLPNSVAFNSFLVLSHWQAAASTRSSMWSLGTPADSSERTQQILTTAGIPCEVVLDSAVGYVMERVDMVLVGCEAVVESGALISSVGTYQVALVAKAMQKPVYALAESYKFLRHYPLSQTDLPMPSGSKTPLTFSADLPTTPTGSRFRRPSGSQPPSGSATPATLPPPAELSKGTLKNQPKFDVTFPELVDFIITDLGTPLSPTSVSQYLVAQFSI